MSIRIQFCFYSFYPGIKRLHSLGLHEPFFYCDKPGALISRWTLYVSTKKRNEKEKDLIRETNCMHVLKLDFTYMWWGFSERLLSLGLFSNTCPYTLCWQQLFALCSLTGWCSVCVTACDYRWLITRGLEGGGDTVVTHTEDLTKTAYLWWCSEE